MTTVHPLQKLCIVPSGNLGDRVLLVASGPLLSAVSLDNGRILSQWPGYDGNEASEVIEEKVREDEGDGSGENNGTNNNSDIRPHKRRKVSPPPTDSSIRRSSDGSDVSVEIVAERKKGERRRPKKPLDEKLPNISHILATQDGKNIVIVTTDNKAITVLEAGLSFHLRVLSERCLPKRLCAIKLTADEQTILAADKFGDVYALPLHASPDWVPATLADEPQTLLVPSATELTVHTKRNRDALRQQLSQKNVVQRKEGLSFEYKILLGHVSLLTDLQVAVGLVNGHTRPFILTADRDEHIRVSRGIPQAHIIETYCLGHRDFVTKLCILPWAPEILVAGNGEPSLRIFRWQTGEMLECLPLTNLARDEGADRQSSYGPRLDKLAVSGIWPVTLASAPTPKFSIQANNVLLVAFEGLPQLHTFCIDEATGIRHLKSQTLDRNILDVVHITGTSQILVSLDVVHDAGSMKVFQASETPNRDGLQMFELKAGKKLSTSNSIDFSAASNGNGTKDTDVWWTKIDDSIVTASVIQECYSPFTISNPTTTAIKSTATSRHGRKKEEEKLYSSLGEFLYGLENLRKKRDIVDEAEDDGEGEGEGEGAVEVEAEVEVDNGNVTPEEHKIAVTGAT